MGGFCFYSVQSKNNKPHDLTAKLSISHIVYSYKNSNLCLRTLIHCIFINNRYISIGSFPDKDEHKLFLCDKMLVAYYNG